MDPVSYAFIFVVGWVASHAFSEKRDEYSTAQEAHRQKYLAKLDRDHPSWGRARREQYLRNAARRNALGHFAYLLRHGWSSTFNDFHHGWKKAKAAHEEWKDGRPKDGKKLGWWVTFKAGWKDSLARRPKATGYYERRGIDPEPSADPEPDPPEKTPRTDTQPDTTRNADPWLDEDQARDAKILPWTGTTTPGSSAGPTNGASVTTRNITGEAHNLDDVRRNSAAFVNTLLSVNGAADQLLADTMRFASKDTQTRAHIERGMEALLAALAEFRAIPQSLQKHQGGEEYAQTSHSVDDMSALRPS